MRLSEGDYQELMVRRKARLRAPQLPVCEVSVLEGGMARRGRMNKLEAAYEREVLVIEKARGLIQDYWFECFKLQIAPGAWFTVDFFVLMANHTLQAREVKGFVREAAMVRIKVAAGKYPFDFFMCFKKKKHDGGGWLIKKI